MVTLAEAWGAVAVEPEGSVTESRRVIRQSLHAVRTHLGMEVGFVGRFAHGRRFFEFVDAEEAFVPISPGGSDALEASFCARVVSGRIPCLIPDATAEPGVADLAATWTIPVGAHLSVPLQQQGGDAFGTLCCFSRTADYDLGERDLRVLRMVGDVVGTHLHFLMRHQERRAHVTTWVCDVIDTGGPTIALQPIVDVDRDSVCGYEALARFPAEAGWSPDRWFAEAAGVGLGAELEAAAIRAALALLPRLPETAFLSVNVSPAALVACESITRMLARHGDRLVLELTEHERATPSPVLRTRLAALHGAGVRVAVDDAGSGYAGLQHIVDLHPEVLKLDRALVQGVAADPGRQALCEAMVAFTRRTGATLVAEGVEHPEDLEVLRSLGVQRVQGYLLGRPAVWE